jgi:Ca2+-transporting ATPase
MNDEGAVMKTRQEMDWYAIESSEVLKKLGASDKGLSVAQVSERRQRFGVNSIEAEEGEGPLKLLVRQINNPLIYLLMGAAIISLVTGHKIDAGVIAGVVVLNTILGFIQEWRAEGALAALREMSAPHAKVLRDADRKDIEASEVVPGDILLLETGDRVPADALVLSSEDLHVDESALTGESQPVAKKPTVLPENTPVADRVNMVWMSTHVTGGRGRAVVVETGMQTQMGRIAGEVRSTEREQTPLQKRMSKLGLLLGILGIGLAGVVFVLGLLRGYEFLEMLLFAVAVAVSAIPEGLPAVISVTLALGVRRMARRHAIIRRLPAVETLGSTTVICSDKTGTITKNQMTVQKVWAGAKGYDVTGEGYAPEGKLQTEDGKPISPLPVALRQLLEIGVLANNAKVRSHEGEWRVEGNPSEGALVVVGLKAGMDEGRMRNESARIKELPFSSDRKYMATLQQTGGDRRRLYVKGASDRIVNYCTHILMDDRRVELNEALREQLEQVNEAYSNQALRVMAGAYREWPKDKEEVTFQDAEQGLTLAGFWGMIDPPRAESVQAVADAKSAGIHPVMITGDHAVTALAIARQVGIARDGGRALTGRDIDELQKPDLANAALEAGVFGRVSPAHKLKILEALKEKGEVVAMTGDGVNDAPALKGADIGVAMGMAGTAVAKEAADMVLTDDNFATIVHAVEEGRIIFSNIRRVIFFLLTTNLGEVLTLIGALVIGLDLPLTAVMILWVNLVTDGACTIPLGVEPKHGDVLKQPPIARNEPVLNWSYLRRMMILTPIMAIGTLGLFYYEMKSGNFDHAQTIAFTTMAAFQWFHAFNARSHYQSIFKIGVFSNRWLLWGVSAAILLQIATIHTPVGRMLFGTTPLSLVDWLLIVLVTSSIWVVDEILKKLGVHGRKE